MRPPALVELDYTVITQPRLRALAKRGTVRRYRKDTVVMEEGDRGDLMLIMLTGRLRAYSASQHTDREVTYGVYGAGDLVGEMSLDGGARSASVITLETTVCSIVTRETVRSYIAEEPEFAFDLIARVIERARRATHTARSLALTDAYGRLSELLTGLAVVQGDGTKLIEERLTHQEIANRIGCSREMVSRLMKDLEVGGYLASTEGRRWCVVKSLPARW